jgi:hypothetical protein
LLCEFLVLAVNQFRDFTLGSFYVTAILDYACYTPSTVIDTRGPAVNKTDKIKLAFLFMEPTKDKTMKHKDLDGG